MRNDVCIQGDVTKERRDPLPEVNRQGFPQTEVTAHAKDLGLFKRRRRICESLEVYSKPVTNVEPRLLVTKRFNGDPLNVRYTGFWRNLWIAYLIQPPTLIGRKDGI
jgi:hypothetical protein